MTQPLLPQSFWVRLALPCRHASAFAKPGGPRLVDLGEAFTLPATSSLEGREPTATVRAAWNAGGLALQIEAAGGLPPQRAYDSTEVLCGASLWIDTRDTRDVSRATRFCHRFDVSLSRATLKSAPPRALVTPRPISRAIADAPRCRPDDVPARAELLKQGWRLELIFPAVVLNGFDPDTNRRLGFTYQVIGLNGAEHLGPGDTFPVGENPSLWSTLELRDDAPA